MSEVLELAIHLRSLDSRLRHLMKITLNMRLHKITVSANSWMSIDIGLRGAV